MSLAKFRSVERASIFTRLGFTPKLLLVVVITVLAFLWESPIATAGLAAFLLAACAVAGVKRSYLSLLIQVMLPFYVLLLLTHGFWNVEQVKRLTGHAKLTPLLSIPMSWWLVGGGSLSLEGLLYGANVIFKTLALMLVMPLTIFTTDVDQMIVSMVRLRIPYRLTFVFSATLRFFPMLFEDVQTIIEAQRLRGLSLEKMGISQRVRVYSKIAVPLILGAMVKAQQLEVVLQSKAFTGSPRRTYLHESELSSLDWAIIVLLLALLATALVVYFGWGVGKFGWLIF